jgi:hypothetical protein
MSATATKSVVLDYYNFDKLFSFNGVFNFLIGGRGLGKTYGAKHKAITAAIRKGDEFIYMRRYKEELATSRDSFFADIYQEFPEYDFRVTAKLAQMAPVSTREVKKREWKTIGYFIPLSVAQSQKSVSFPKVKLIIFDEFIIEKGAIHYLRDEAIAFINFFSTVDRYKDKTRVLFLANSVTIENPYFLHFDIRPDQVGEFTKSHEGFIVCHFADSKEFSKGVYKTRFGKFIQGTEYADYAVTSEFKDNNDNLVARKPADAKYSYTVEARNGTFSVWIDWEGPHFYIQEKRPRQENMYTLVPEKMRKGVKLITNSDRLIANLRTAWRNGETHFDTPRSRNAFIEIFK